MPKTIVECTPKHKGTYYGLYFSNDWFSLTPWSHKGEKLSWFAYRKSEKSQMMGVFQMTYYYVGPFCLIFAKLEN